MSRSKWHLVGDPPQSSPFVSLWQLHLLILSQTTKSIIFPYPPLRLDCPVFTFCTWWNPFLCQQHPILSPALSTLGLATVSFLNYWCKLPITFHVSPLSPINSVLHAAARVRTTSWQSQQSTNGSPSCSEFVLIPYPSPQALPNPTPFC